MQLTVRDVARMLGVSENDVFRWISSRELPAKQINGQYRFNQAELLEWATVRKVEISQEFLRAGNGAAPGFAAALELGGVLHGISGDDREAVLQEVVRRMPLPEDYDRDFLLQVLISRETLGSTAVGDGIALPHPRYPVVVPLDLPFITLCFLKKPIAYGPGAADPVHTLFALISPTVRVHLALLARLAAALRDPSFHQAVKCQASAEEILAQAVRTEEKLRDAPAKSAREKS